MSCPATKVCVIGRNTGAGAACAVIACVVALICFVVALIRCESMYVYAPMAITTPVKIPKPHMTTAFALFCLGCNCCVDFPHRLQNTEASGISFEQDGQFISHPHDCLNLASKRTEPDLKQRVSGVLVTAGCIL